MKILLFLIAILSLVVGAMSAQSKPIALTLPTAEQLINVKAEEVTFKGRKALRVTEAAAAANILNVSDKQMVILPNTELQDGVIEIELAGEPAPNAAAGARGFVGVAFHVAPKAEKFECFYLRPTNGRADDQVRRNHSVQYISHPGFPWERLRKEFPEKYESYVDLEPGVWTKMKIEVKGTTARLFVHGAAQPTLIVNDLKLGVTKGALGLWIGPGTIAHFTNLRVRQ
jgi:hypothetical protein